MASGQLKGKANVELFKLWQATQSDDDLKQIVFRGQLNRVEIAKALGCGKSALNQNPELKKELKLLEANLRNKGVLPALTKKAEDTQNEIKQYDKTTQQRRLDSKRVSTLEQENIELKAKVKELETRLMRFGELSETLAEMGFMPR
ncbi:VPA1267 family protein [Paraglaciecola mesophila]|uniref:VPA1267 family protein n=2 Tax=Paraglaciecola mesophila TaxID=197222 RepID=A0ABU9SW62_9ALTE